ncbi:oxygen-evolving enhancer protein 3, chloroplastic [Solanum pennellii]|uniref:Oxygen-evolving enhancer protein 3, chloroplastic n=1 Tax=Solanum pennellii TaxID=28526 RepID=A0ABM1G4L8_SOLPN|nr:oxygen-evolving enhancer protein 3, chloroplastic [Solanum pennellii]
MAHAMASMGGLIGSSQTVLDGSLQLSGSARLSTVSTNRIALSRPGLTVRAQQGSVDIETSRRAMIGLVASGLAASVAKAAFAEARSIKVGPPPPPSGGLPGTLNSDEARDFSLPLKNRFYLQPLTPAEAAQRVKDSAKEIVSVKDFIDKKAWPYVQNDLRLRAEYLRYDLKTVISAMPKEQKGKLQDLSGKLFKTISDLDHAAKTKNSAEAQKYYAETVTTLNDVLANLG